MVGHLIDYPCFNRYWESSLTSWKRGTDPLFEYNTVVSNQFHSVNFFFIFVRQITWFRWNVQHWTSCVNVHNKISNRYVPFWRSILNFKKILTFSVKDIYQLNYFICIKDFNAETITSLKLNLFSFFICCCQHHERKTICLCIFLIPDR